MKYEEDGTACLVPQFTDYATVASEKFPLGFSIERLKLRSNAVLQRVRDYRTIAYVSGIEEPWMDACQ